MIGTHGYDFGHRDQCVLADTHPRINVQFMLNRVKLVYDLFKRSFKSVSGIYIGKSVNMRVRFNHHQRQKKKDGHMLAMITIALFTPGDVPSEDVGRWDMSSEVVALNYERLLTRAVLDAGLPTFGPNEEPGGGGRSADDVAAREAAVYMLLSVSN